MPKESEKSRGASVLLRYNTVYAQARIKIFRFFALSGICAALVAFCFNLIVGFSPLAVWIHALAVLVMLPILLYKENRNILRWGVTTLLYFCFVYTPITWFAVDGLISSMPYIIVFFATALVFMLDGRYERWVLAAYLLEVAVLLLHDIISQRYTYVAQTQLWGCAFGFLVMLLASVIIFTYIKRRFVYMSDSLYTLSHQDALTGLFNARYLQEAIVALEEEYQRRQQDYFFVMIDVDDFKAINDRFGHQSGDTVLQNIAALLQQRADEHMLLCRYGGDEFVVLAHGLGEPHMFAWCEELRRAIAAQSQEQAGPAVTVSIGMDKRANVQSPADLFQRADLLMYNAKRQRAEAKIAERRVRRREDTDGE